MVLNPNSGDVQKRVEILEDVVFCMWALISGKLLRSIPVAMAAQDAHEAIIDHVDEQLRGVQEAGGVERLVELVDARIHQHPEFLSNRSLVLSLAIEKVQDLSELSARLWVKCAAQLVTGYPPDDRIKELGNKVGIADLNKWIAEGDKEVSEQKL